MTPPIIRPAANDDFEAIAALTNHFILNTTIHFGYEPTTADALRAAWSADRDHYPWLIIQLSDSGPPRFAGYAKAGTWRARTAYSWTCETGVYIDPTVHRRGLGRSLYSALLENLRTRGFHSVVAGITLPNDPSIRLHESIGFTKVGHVADAGYKFNQWHDVGFWQILLRERAHTPRPL